MGKIRILSDNLVSKIAAGEIVERPASVVKELVENAIDAGGTDIKIELESGGKRLIRITDNGEGMTRDEALLSLERHATSKIKDINDLFSVKSLGFRGEAIPSIISISRFKITSKTENELIGTEIKGEGGVIKSVEETGSPTGTEFLVRNLFYNTPVRLKFMKKIETELTNILDIVQRQAIPRPSTAFELVHDSKTLIRLPGRDNILDRINDIYPKAELFAIDAKADGVSISGYLGGPLDTRSNTLKLFTYINNRPVRDKFLTRIIIDSYGKMLEKGKFPQGVIFLQLPAGEVDVNVHPTKNEVRFRNNRLIAELIKSSVYEMLRGAPWLKGDKERAENSIREFYNQKQTDFVPRVSGSSEPLSDLHLNVSHIRDSGDPDVSGYKFDRSSDQSFYEPQVPEWDSAPESQRLFQESGYYSKLRIIGQLKELYIICESETGMFLIDQHAAHERINYERIKNAYINGKEFEKQELLVPQIVELSPHEARLLEKNKDQVEKLGLIVEEFGDNSFVIRSVPALLGGTDYTNLIKDIVSEIAETGKEESLTESVERIISTMACHSSIKANDLLNHEEMRALLEKLDQAEFPHSCPHGRPVAQKISYAALERMFKRT